MCSQPTQSEVHTDAVLSNISVAYIQEQSRFIASKVFPMVPVEKQSDKFYTYPKNSWFLDEAQPRADATEAAGSGYAQSTDDYSCKVYAIRKDVGDQVMANSDPPLNPLQDAARFVTQKLLIRQEIQWVTDCFTTSKWGKDWTGDSDFTQWDDETSSDPIEDVGYGKEYVLSITGFEPNALILGYQVYRKLNKHPDLIERIKYGGAALAGVTAPAMAQAFGVDRVLVATAIKATNVEGQTATYDFAFGKHALLAYIAPSPGLLAPSAGYTFMWKGVSQGMGLNVGVKRYRIEEKACNRVEAQMAWANKIVGSDLGFFFSGCVA